MPEIPPSSFDPRAARRTLVLVAVAVASSVLSGTMTNVALPLIARDLGVDPARLGWLVTGYLLVFAIATPFYGRLADRFGARRLFVGGLTVFALGSLLCALARTYPWLLAGRLVQAGGSAAIPGLGLALVSRAYPAERRGSALGIISAAVGSGAAVGPTLGGVLAGALGWPAVFGVTVFSGFLAPFAWRLIPPGSRRGSEPVDWLGGLLLALTVAGTLLAATEASRGAPGAPPVVRVLAVSVLGGLGLVIRQRMAAAPFLPRALLHNLRFVALVSLSCLAMASNLPAFVAVPLLLTEVNHLSPVQVGLALLPQALVFTLLGPVAGRVVDRVGPRWPIRSGLASMSIALATLSTVGAGAPAWVVSGLMAVLSAGFAFVNTPLTVTVSLLVPPARLASGMSFNSMLFFLGGAFGTALVAAVLTARAAATQAFNPVYGGAATAYSDAFLILLVLVLGAMILTLMLPGQTARAATPDAVRSPRSAPPALDEQG